MTRIGKMYFDDEMTTAEIAAATGYSQRQVQRLVRKAGDIIKQMYAESIGVRVIRHDMRIQDGIDGFLDASTDDTGQLVILPRDLPPLTAWQTYIAKRTGQLESSGAPAVQVQVNSDEGDGDVSVSVAAQVVARTARVMAGLDAINLDGVGSGRTPEEQLAALKEIGPVFDVVDAELVEDDDDLYEAEYDDDSPLADADDSTITDTPGRWVNGFFVPFWNESPWLWVAIDDLPEADPTFYNGPTW